MLPRVSNPPRATSMRRPPPPPTRIHLPVKAAVHKPAVGKHRLRAVRIIVLSGAVFSLLPFLVAAIVSDMSEATDMNGDTWAPRVAAASVTPRLRVPVDQSTTPNDVGEDQHDTAVESHPEPRWTVGSTKATVESIEGPPRSINRHPSRGEEQWCYGYEMRDTVTFDLNTGTVVEWQNVSGNLKIGLAAHQSLAADEPAANRPAAGGAEQQQRDRALSAVVDEPRTGPPGEVDVPREDPPKRFWTFGSTKAVVEEIDGPPTSINKYPSLGYEEWHYGLFDTVEFGIPSGKVREWSNLSGQLSVAIAVDGKIAFPEPDATFGEGSTKEEVARAQGTPRTVADCARLGYMEWGYNMFDKVKFDARTGRVTEWDNYTGTLRLRAQKRGQSAGAAGALMVPPLGLGG